MGKMAKIYATAVKKHFRVFYANWEPGGPIELGDYGYLESNIFMPMGNIRRDFPEFQGDDLIQFRTDPTADHKEFKSETGIRVNLMSKGSLSPQGTPLAKAAVEIRFAGKDQIFFNAAECTTTRIANKAAVGQILKGLVVTGKWERHYCLVTDLVKARQTLIAISHGRDSAISFEAGTPAIEKINLADAGVRLNLISERDIGYKVTAAEGLDLLIGLCRFRSPVQWGERGFVPGAEPCFEEDLDDLIETRPEEEMENEADGLCWEQVEE